MGKDFGDLFGGLAGAAILILGLLFLALIVTPIFLLGVVAVVGFKLLAGQPYPIGTFGAGRDRTPLQTCIDWSCLLVGHRD